MIEPIWIQLEVAKAYHEMSILKFGGLPGTRSAAGLESAMERPRQKFHYEPKVDVFDLAAAYAFGIARNHPFSDGNKRTAYLVSMSFLKLNGYSINASREDKIRTFLELASGTLSEEDLAQWFLSHSVKIKA